MILLIDNYDSFTYNLFEYLSEFGEDVLVKRNDGITVEEVAALAPKKIVLSPGPGNPGNPRDFGVCAAIIEEAKEGGKLFGIPVLGVCLGHQGIILHFGGQVVKNKPMHGKTSQIVHDGKGIFAGVPSPMEAMRYHSLVGTAIPECLEVSATSMDDSQIMAVRHKSLKIFGVQFHPESIMTPHGKKILENFLKI